MNVNFYYVQTGSTMPTTFTAGDLYFDANTKKLYRAKSTSEIEAFGGSDITDSNYVHTTGDESIAGAKTFTGNVVVKAPTADMQASTKKYVDDAVSGKANDSGVVHTTGNETVNGVKSFGNDMYVINIGDFDGTNASTASTLQAVIAALGETINDLNARLETVEKTYPNVLYSYDEATQTLSITTL